MANKNYIIKLDGVTEAIKNTSSLVKKIQELEAEISSGKLSGKELEKLQSELESTQKEFQKLNDVLKVPIKTVGDLEFAVEAMTEALKNAEAGTPEFASLTSNLQRARTEVEVFEQSIEAITVEKKIETFTKLGESIAGGFSMATAGTVLFGKTLGVSEEQLEELQKNVDAVMLGLQGYKSLMEGLSGENLKNIKVLMQQITAMQVHSFWQKAGIVQTTAQSAATTLASAAESRSTIVRYAAIVAQRILNAVMMANPIMLVVAAVAALAAGYAFLSNKSEEAAEKQKKLNEELQKGREEADKADNARMIAQRENDIALMKAQGAAAEELYAKEKSLLEKKLVDLAALAKARGHYTDEELKERDALNSQLAVLDVNFGNQTRDERFKQLEFEQEMATRRAKVNQASEIEIARINLKSANERLEIAKNYYAKDSNEFREYAMEAAEKNRELADAILKERQRAFSKIETIDNGDKLDKQVDGMKKAAKDDAEKVDIIPKNMVVQGQKMDFEPFKQSFGEQVKAAAEDASNEHGTFLDNLFGEGTEDTIADFQELLDTVGQLWEDSINEKYDREQELVEERVDFMDGIIDDAQERLDELSGAYDDTLSKIGDMEEELKTARGANHQVLVQQLEEQRAKEVELMSQKSAEQARLRAAEKEKEALAKKAEELEVKRQQQLQKAQKLQALSATVGAVAAGVNAVASAAAMPFPAILFAIPAALAAVIGAIAAAKNLGSKLEDGGVVDGPTHAQGGVRGTGRFANIEVEGGEMVVNKRATARNMEALDVINRFGRNQTFDVVPRQYANGGTLPDFAGMSTVMKTNQTDPTSTAILAQLALLNQTNLAVASRPVPVVYEEIAKTGSRYDAIKETALKTN